MTHFVRYCILALEVSHVQLVDIMFLLQVLFCTCCFVDLTLLVLFLSVFKISKTHKN